MIRIGICDDNKLLVTQLEARLYEIGRLKNIQLNIESFFDGRELIRHYETKVHFDLLFIDIEMEHTNGIQAAARIRELDSHVLIIFCSNHDGYLMELFEVEPFRFLKKPLEFSDILTVFEKAYLKIMEQGLYFEYTFNKDIARIPVQNIYYFESSGRRIIIHTIHGEEEFNGQLSKVEKQLKGAHLSFLRIHQSYLINFQHIKVLSFTYTILQNGKKLPIGTKRQKEIRSQYLDLLR